MTPVADAQAGPEALAPRPDDAVDGPGRGRGLPTRIARAFDAIGGLEAEWWVLSGMVTVWVVVLGRLVLLRQTRFGSFSFDMGILDQAAWLISRCGGLFMSVRGLHF